MNSFEHLDLTSRFLIGLLIQLVRYGVVTGIAYYLFYQLKKEQWLFMKIQKRFPKKKDIQREILYSLLTMLIFGMVGLGIILMRKMGWTQIYTDFSTHSVAYFFLSIGIAIFAHDTYFYWTHRLMHHPKLFPYFHKVHHLSHNPSPWAAFAFHPLEAVVQAAYIPVLVVLIPFHPLALVLFMLWMIILNVLGHTGYEFIPKRFHDSWLGRLQNTPTHHNMHHQLNKGNYGLYFNVWDRLMRTNFRNYEEVYHKNINQKPETQEVVY
jgi:sterol desaturase/sphingolipid hydroxylase (fatty acid hydroxylase superfamily)